MFESMDEIIKSNDSNERLEGFLFDPDRVSIKIQLTPENEQKLFI